MSVGFTSQDDLLIALKNRPPINYFKPGLAAKVAGAWHSMWTSNGSPSAGSPAGSVNGAICTKNTLGAIPFQSPTLDLAVGALTIGCSNVGGGVLYDRLWHNSGLNGTLTTAQTITQPALTRCTDGVGVEIIIEIYAATGSTAVTTTISYTNSDGVSGRIATAFISASPLAGQMFTAVLQAGDKGVLSVQSVTLSATTGTAGNFGVTLAKRVAYVPFSIANVPTQMDAYDLGLPEIGDDACLAFFVVCSTTSTGTILGLINIVEG